MKNMKKWLGEKGIKCWMAKECFFSELKEELEDESGAAFAELFVKIIIIIVLGTLIIGAFYYAFRDTLIPMIIDKLKEMFNPPTKP